jgi:ketosteroid isomerase-like protein
MKFDMQTRNFDVKIYGDTAGMVRRSAESEPERWNLRMTSVWVKEAGEWKLVHRHESHLTLR